MSVLVVTPTAREARAASVPALVSGSRTRAGPAVDRYLSSNRVDCIVIAGFCGGLDPSLAPGDLVLATHVLSKDGTVKASDPDLCAVVQRALRRSGRRFASSGLLTLDRPVRSTAGKRELWNRSGAAGVDMETYDLIDCLDAHSVPWIALRAVLDPAGTSLPAPMAGWRGEGDEPALVRALAARPATWLSVLRLTIEMHRASRALAQGLPLVLSAARSWELAGGASRRRDRE